MSSFRKASRKKLFLRLGLDGPAGGGKTFSAARAAFTLGKRVAVINTERGAIEKYVGLAPDGVVWDFDIMDLENFAPTAYTQAIFEAARLGYDVLIIDSLSHAWNGVGGALEIVNTKGGNSYTAWKDVTPMHNAMVEAILRAPLHIIATIRSKMEYVLEPDDKGRQVPRKVGMAPVQRNGMEYEFDVFCDIDLTHTLTVSKTRCPDIDGEVIVKPDAMFFGKLARWLNEGSSVDASYYSATEEDLRRSMEAREEAAREAAKHAGGNGHAEPAKVDAKELMRQRAAAAKTAKQAGSGDDGDGSAGSPVVAPNKPKDGGSATEGPQGSASSSATGAGEEAPPPPVKKPVAAAKPAAAQKPSGSPKLDKAEADLAKQAATPSPAPLAGVRVVSADTLKRIDHYGPLAYPDDWPNAKAFVLKKYGIGSLRSLNHEQAESLLEKLMAKSMGLEKANKEIHERNQAAEKAGAGSKN